MGTLTSRMGTQKAHVCKIDQNKLIRWNIAFIREEKLFFTRTVKLAWDSQVLVVLLQVITWLTLYSGCMDFSRGLYSGESVVYYCQGNPTNRYWRATLHPLLNQHIWRTWTQYRVVIFCLHSPVSSWMLHFFYLGTHGKLLDIGVMLTRVTKMSFYHVNHSLFT